MHQQTTLLFGLLLAGLPFLGSRTAATAQDSKLERLKYNHPGLVVDLGAKRNEKDRHYLARP